MMQNGEQILGQPLTTNAVGDGNNKSVEVYRQFTASSAVVDILFYTEEKPDQTVDVTIPLSVSNSTQP